MKRRGLWQDVSEDKFKATTAPGIMGGLPLTIDGHRIPRNVYTPDELERLDSGRKTLKEFGF